MLVSPHENHPLAASARLLLSLSSRTPAALLLMVAMTIGRTAALIVTGAEEKAEEAALHLKLTFWGPASRLEAHTI